MRSPSSLILCIPILFAMTPFAIAQPPDEKPAAAQSESQEAAKDTPAANPASEAEQAVRQASKEFGEAFNAGDAEKVAALWTADAEYIDESGERYVGRDTIKKEFAEFFKANPKAKIVNVIDAIHLAGPSAAIEDGRETVTPPPVGAPATSRYTAVYVLEDGKWLLASVRDTKLPNPTSYHQLTDFEWLIGTWTGGKDNVQITSHCRWLGNKSFIERAYEVTDSGIPVASGKQIIGWDPEQQQVHSWTFTSDGGHSQSLWAPHDSGWWTQSSGVTGDGTRTSAVIVLRKQDDNTLIWKSTDRTVGGARLPDLDEVVLKRVVEKP